MFQEYVKVLTFGSDTMYRAQTGGKGQQGGKEARTLNHINRQKRNTEQHAIIV